MFNDAKEGGELWGWSPASALASPAVLNSFLQSQVPVELVGKAKGVVSRDVLAGKIVGEVQYIVTCCFSAVVEGTSGSSRWVVF